MNKKSPRGKLSLSPLSLEDALRGALGVDPKKVKASEAAEKKKRRKK